MGTPVRDNPATGPKTHSADPAKPAVANIISYHPVGARGLLKFSQNIPSGADAIAAIKAAADSGVFQGTECDRIALLTGGTRSTDTSTLGGTEIVVWTPKGGFVSAVGENWESQVANPAPAPVAAPAPVRTGGDAPGGDAPPPTE